MNKKLPVLFMYSVLFMSIQAMADTTTQKPQGKANNSTIEDIVVEGTQKPKTKNYSDVYRSTVTKDYYNKADIEKRFIGNPGDLISATPGVFSADNRNSGAIDVNIRGIQGQSRIPLTVDGTEQAITVYRGMSGVNNRNYIDPSLISEVFVEKGITLSRDSAGSVGGSVRMKTLGADDIVIPGKNFGVKLIVDHSSNSAKNRYPDYLFGKYRTDYEPKLFNSYEDTSMLMSPAAKSGTLSSFKNDRSVLLGFAAKNDIAEGVLAYSYRQKGNHFAGKSGTKYYRNVNHGDDVFQKSMTDFFTPGQEIPNTHSNSSSILVRGKIKPTPDQSLEAVFRHTNLHFGEIMPYRLYAIEDNLNDKAAKEGKQFRDNNMHEYWPDSIMNINAYSLQYDLNPKENPWVNFSTQIWHTRAGSMMNNDAKTTLDIPFNCRNLNDPSVIKKISTMSPECYFYNAAAFKINNTRTGLNVSNTFKLSPKLNLSLMARGQKERRDKDTSVGADSVEDKLSLLQRDVSRQEQDYSFNFEWKPTDWLILNAGMRKLKSSGKDRGNYDPNLKYHYLDSIEYRIQHTMTQEDKYEMMRHDLWTLNDYIQYKDRDMPYGAPDKHVWHPDKQGHFHLKDNPFFNGDVVKFYNETGLKPFSATQGGQGTTHGGAGRDGGVKVSHHYTSLPYKDLSNKKYRTPWTPVLSAEIKITPQFRLLAGYAQSWRTPNIYEMYPMINQAGGRNIGALALSSEKSTNYEVSLAYDMSEWFDDQFADIRFTYFNNKIDNMIDKDFGMVDNVGQLKTQGLELQGRYTGERLAVKLGVTENFKNEFCQYGVHTSPYLVSEPRDFNNNWVEMDASGKVTGVGSIVPKTPLCYEGGKPMGLVASMVQPKLSANFDISGKFFDNKLLIGTNVKWFSKYNGHYQRTIEKTNQTHAYVGVPLGWGSSTIVDLYTNYEINKNFSIKGNIHNLTNRYYLDPLSRAYMPAPGRTITFGITGRY